MGLYKGDRRFTGIHIKSEVLEPVCLSALFTTFQIAKHLCDNWYKLTENLLTGKDNNNFKLAQHSLQLLTYAHRDTSIIRGQQLKEVVVNKYEPLSQPHC